MRTHAVPERAPLPALAVGAAILAFVLAAIAFAASVPEGGWFAGLARPSWTPRAGTLLSLALTTQMLIGLSTWLLWRERDADVRARRRALWLVSALLALNLLSLPLLLASQRPLMAFACLCSLWLCTVSALYVSVGVPRMVSRLLLPCLAWLSFAVVLQGSIFLMNL